MSCCSPETGCFEYIKALAPAFIALIIGLIAAGITIRQYLVAKAKLKLDLFDRRYRVYLETRDALFTIFDIGYMDLGKPPFVGVLSEAQFLFEKEIYNYLEECSKNGMELSKMVGQEDSAVIQGKKQAIQDWFKNEYFDRCRTKFGKYLDFSRWK